MTAYKVCPFGEPVCGLRVDLIERKDFESFTGSEFVAHLEAVHPEVIGPIGYPYVPEQFDEENA